MLRALYSGVAGLKTHQTKMDVIGNNIANVNTYGFKSSRASFKDVFYQTISGTSEASKNMGGGNASQVGYGSMVSSIDVLHTRAGYTPTGRAMDVFIEGEGFLIARDGAGNEKYTRVGIMNFDGQGNLVDANRNYICGYPIARDATGNILYEDVVPASATTSVSGMTIDFGEANGSSINGYSVNVTLGATTSASVDSNKSINIVVAAGATAADIQTVLQGLPISNLPAGFDASLITFTGTVPTTAITGAPVANGVDAQTGIPKLNKADGPQIIKKPGTLTDTNNDGIPDVEAADVAELSGIAIGADGIISGTTTNGTIIPIGQICLANVPNPEALVLDGNSYFKPVNNTGEIKYAGAGDGVSGSLISGGLEMSNVDLSTEFADMIITQRGFQANSRIITVGDEMLQELVNMKR